MEEYIESLRRIATEAGDEKPRERVGSFVGVIKKTMERNAKNGLVSGTSWLIIDVETIPNRKSFESALREAFSGFVDLSFTWYIDFRFKQACCLVDYEF